MRGIRSWPAALTVPFCAGALVALAGCGSEAEEPPADTPTAPSRSEPTATQGSGSTPRAPSTDRTPAKSRVCYAPSTWKRYACTPQEFERNKVAVERRLPSSTDSCVNAQGLRFYCYQPSERSGSSGR